MKLKEIDYNNLSTCYAKLLNRLVIPLITYIDLNKYTSIKMTKYCIQFLVIIWNNIIQIAVNVHTYNLILKTINTN